jgi:hypothetical protein
MLRQLTRLNVPAVRAFSSVRSVQLDIDISDYKPEKRADWATHRKQAGKSFEWDQDSHKSDADKRQAPIRMGEERLWREGKIGDRTGVVRDQWK